MAGYRFTAAADEGRKTARYCRTLKDDGRHNAGYRRTEAGYRRIVADIGGASPLTRCKRPNQQPTGRAAI